MPPAVGKVLKSLGIGRIARMSLKVAETKDVWPLPLKIYMSELTDPRHGLRQSQEEKSAIKLADTISGWLHPYDLKLTDEGKSRFVNFYTEIVDNSRHAGVDFKNKAVGRWAVSGFMARRDGSGGDEFWCHLSFVTLGGTIAQSLRHPKDKNVLTQILDYANRHRKHDKNQSQDALITVAALQDGISSDKFAREAGGTGLGTLLNDIGMLAKGCSGRMLPHISVISGDCCILLHPPYNSLEGDSGSARQWFNPENSKEAGPDPANVYCLPYFMPGTIITIRFGLDGPGMVKSLAND
jgi:hypothetical protein